jgi:NAD(P)H dehydrogenase (quinone)
MFKTNINRSTTMIAITGANGQLGQLVIQALLQKTNRSEFVALVRNTEKAHSLKALGVQVRQADYNQANTLAPALKGVDTLLLISGSEIGQRVPQHQAVIQAAKEAGVNVLAYTSILKADTSPLILAQEHKATEQAIKDSGLDSIILRNGWYNENYSENLQGVLQLGVVASAAQDGQFSTASRQDYAQAAANVLLSPQPHLGKVYELAGDNAYNQQAYAQEVAKQSHKAIKLLSLTTEDFSEALVSHGLPQGFADVLADSDLHARDGWLFDDSGELSKLIGRKTTTIEQSIREALTNL